MTATIAEARTARAAQLRKEADLKFREADALRRLADEADQEGLGLQQRAWDYDPC